MISETKRKAKVKNKATQKQKKEVLKSSILLLPIFAKKLTTKERNALKPSEFVYPDTREYPIQDTAHAINALSRSTQSGDPAIIKKVHDAVYKRYPFLKKGKKSKASYAHGPHNLRILDNVLNTYAATKQIQVTPRGNQIIIVVNSTVLKLDRDALYQPAESFSKIITKLADTIDKAPSSTTKDIMAQQQATLAKYQAMVQTYTDKIAKLKAEMQKHMAQE